MTVGIAYRVPGVGAVLAHDGRITHDGAILTESAKKHVICGRTPVLVAGTVDKAWRGLQVRPPKSFEAFLDEVDEKETDWLAYDRRGDRLWLCAIPLKAPFATLGTGDSIALGALDAMPVARTLESAKACVLRALQITFRRHAECGGRIRVLVVPRRGRILE